MDTVLLEEKIKKARLTRTEQAVADYVLDNFPDVCFMKATDVSSALGISDTSVIRFSRSIGYSGFAEMQRELQKEMTEKMVTAIRPNDTVIQRSKRLASYMDEKNLMNKYLEVVLNNFEESFKKNSFEKLEEISKTILQSNRKFIVGFKGCMGLANQLSKMLKVMLEDVRLINYADSSAIEIIMDAGREDCVILFSFPRYARMAIKIAERAKAAGAKLVVFTDKVTASVANSADIILGISVDSIFFSNSYVVPTFFLEVLAADIQRKCGQSIKDRMEAFESLIMPDGLF